MVIDFLTDVANAIFLLLELDQLFRWNDRHFGGSMDVCKCVVGEEAKKRM